MNKSESEIPMKLWPLIDVVRGRGGMFSLENGRDVRFLTRSRLFTKTEEATLPAL